MLLALGLALLILLIAPPLALLLDARRQRASVELGFWTFTRRVSGRCHVAWRRGRLPIISLDLPDATARVHVSRARGGWSVEVRAYQRLSFGFVALISDPPQRPTLWYTPSLQVVELYPEELGYPGEVSLESNDEALLRWLLQHEGISDLLELSRDRARAAQICAAHSLLSARVEVSGALSPGEAIEAFGPPLVDAIKRLSADLTDLASAMRDADEFPAEEGCPGCGRPLDEDPWRCDACDARLHRGCREMLSGCASPHCEHAIDAFSSSP